MAIDKISLDNLSVSTRHCLYIILILALAGMWYWICQKPRNEELSSLNGKNEHIRMQLRQAEAVNARYDQYQADLVEIDARLAALQVILPTEKEAAAFLRTIQDMAASSNLKINLFKPKALVPRDFYSDWPVEIRLEGNYHGLGRFFERLSKATRIVDVPTINISNIDNQSDPRWTLVANGTVTTYVRGVQSGQSEE